MSDPRRPVEDAISNEIVALDKRISELMEERRVLERLLMRARRERVANIDVSRKNSINRVLVENKITSTLELIAKPLEARDLYMEAKSVVLDLKHSTFRSHLKRMKDKGMIKQMPGHNGKWYIEKSDK